MEQIVKLKKYYCFLFVMMIMFTSFEYFFRSEYLQSYLALIVLFTILNKKITTSLEVRGLFIGLFFIFLFQPLFFINYSIVGCITRMTVWICAFALAILIKENYLHYYVKTITYIAIYSLFIYILSYIPQVRDFLLYSICPNFPSLGVEKAIQEGGGQNFIIYNYQFDYLNEALGYYRNCGPFWEPGMFACFLDIALFFNIIYSGKNGYLFYL